MKCPGAVFRPCVVECGRTVPVRIRSGLKIPPTARVCCHIEGLCPPLRSRGGRRDFTLPCPLARGAGTGVCGAGGSVAGWVITHGHAGNPIKETDYERVRLLFHA